MDIGSQFNIAAGNAAKVAGDLSPRGPQQQPVRQVPPNVGPPAARKTLFEDEENDLVFAHGGVLGGGGERIGDLNLGPASPQAQQLALSSMGLYNPAASAASLGLGAQNPSQLLAASVASSRGAYQLGRSVSQPVGSQNPAALAGGLPLGLAAMSTSPSKQLFGSATRSMFQQIRKTPQFGNQLGTLGLLGGPPSRQEMNFDPSDFPQLGSRPNPMPSTAGPNRNYVGIMSKPTQEQVPEFDMTQEDFPALPGAQIPPSANSDPGRQTGTPGSVDSGPRDGPRFPGDTSNGGPGAPGSQRRGIQTSSEGMVSNIPDSMLKDRFGIAGLLTFIRGAEADPSLCALAPGVDLTTLGLNLNSVDNLYSTFQSPWADQPCRPQDIDFHVPAEYQTNVYIRDKLAQIKLNHYNEDVLFFLFYFFTGDCLQLLAAAELYNRDWRYHKEDKFWLTRATNADPKSRTRVGETNVYLCFDRNSWSKQKREFFLEYEKLEERPQLPSVVRNLVSVGAPGVPHLS